VRDVRVADVGIDRQRVLRRQVARPVDGADRVVQFVRRGDGKLGDGTQHADGRAQPEIGLIERVLAADKVNAAAAGFDLYGADGAQLIGEDGFQTTGTGGEELGHSFRLAAVKQARFCERRLDIYLVDTFQAFSRPASNRRASSSSK